MINPRLIEISPDVWVRADRITALEQTGPRTIIVTTSDGNRHWASRWTDIDDLARHITQPD